MQCACLLLLGTGFVEDTPPTVVLFTSSFGVADGGSFYLDLANGGSFLDPTFLVVCSSWDRADVCSFFVCPTVVLFADSWSGPALVLFSSVLR